MQIRNSGHHSICSYLGVYLIEHSGTYLSKHAQYCNACYQEHLLNVVQLSKHLLYTSLQTENNYFMHAQTNSFSSSRHIPSISKDNYLPTMFANSVKIF